MNTEKRSLSNPRTKHTYLLTCSGHATETVWCGTGKDYLYGEIFVKVLHYGNYPKGKQKDARKDAQAEADLMKRVCNCPVHVPKLYDHWDDPAQQCYVLVMQKMPGQTLKQWEAENRIKQYDEQSIRLRILVFYNLTVILRDIHRKLPFYGHLDLKPDNVMIWPVEENKWQVGLIDFGTAALNHSVNVGTYGYQAPEQLASEGNKRSSPTQKDIFALGMILHELLSGQPAPLTYGEFLPDFDSLEWTSRPSLPAEVIATRKGPRLQRLFDKMTSRDPDKRPTLEQVVQMLPLK